MTETPQPVGSTSQPIPISAENQERAEKIKNDANKLFAEKSYEKSITKYDEAIQLNPTVAAYYSNRALAYIKTEGYGFALRDANKAIEIDSRFVKAYYRRASANMGLMKFKEALQDFKSVVKFVPNDLEAKQKLNECTKIVQQKLFEEAIATEGTKVVDPVEYLGNLNDIVVEKSYQGPHLPETGITLEFVENMIAAFLGEKKLHQKYAYKIMVATKSIFEKLPSLVEIEVPEESTITVCGDVHGQFYDLVTIFNKNGMPSPTNMYLFNGDFVDRGVYSVEVILTLLAFKLLYPKSFFMSRGNHETDDMNKVYGFEREVCSKYSSAAMKVFSAIFNAIPLCNVINKKIIVLHGGLFSRDDVSLEEIKNIDRYKQPGQSGLMCELLWSDPSPSPGRLPSFRGIGIEFGPDVTEKFLNYNNLNLLIRSHEVQDEGYKIDHNGKCITVFSAPDYCDQMKNLGAYIKISHDLTYKIEQFQAVWHPKRRAKFTRFGF